MSITARFDAILKSLSAVSHKTEEGAFEMRSTIRSIRQLWGDEDVSDSIVEKFEIVSRRCGVKSQRFGCRDSLWCAGHKQRYRIRSFHSVLISVEGKGRDRKRRLLLAVKDFGAWRIGWTR